MRKNLFLISLFLLDYKLQYDGFPAKIVYDPAIDDYGGTLASVKIRDMPPVSGDTWNWLRTVAKAHAAGGVISRLLLPSLLDVGDLDDKKQFLDLCKTLQADNPQASIDGNILWKQAQDAVLRELTTIPELLSKLEAVADSELAPQLGLS